MLAEVTIGVPTFLRPGYLARCIQMLQATLPECPIIVCDDSYETPVVPPNVKLISLPFDSGLPAKRNCIAQATTTKYLLMYTDDFATDANTRAGIEKLLAVMENNPDVDVASGRVDGNPYEGYLYVEPGEYIKEYRLTGTGVAEYFMVDITVNYWMIRPQLLAEVPQDVECKIGGEHAMWFFALRQHRKLVVFVPGVNVTTLHLCSSAAHPEYHSYRSRAVSLGHAVLLQKHNVKQYFGFDDPEPKPTFAPLPPPPPNPYPNLPRLMIAIVGHWASRLEVYTAWQNIVVDYRIFYGRQPAGVEIRPENDEIVLNVDDECNGLPNKIKAICNWMLPHGSSHAFVVDYDKQDVDIDHLLKNFKPVDYERVSDGYWISEKMMRVIVDEPLSVLPPEPNAEDHWVASVLHKHGVEAPETQLIKP